MAANATSVKELNIRKECCNALNVSHSSSSKKNQRPMLDWKIKDPRIHKGQRIWDECQNTILNFHKSFGSEGILFKLRI